MNFALTRVRVALTAISTVLAIAGCGGGSGGSSGGPPPASSPAPTQTPVSHGTPTPTPQSTTTPHSTPTASPTSLATPTASPTSVSTPTSTPLSCPSGPSPTPAPPGQVVVTPACVVLNNGNNVAVTVSGGNGNYALTNDTCDGGIIASITQSANPDVYDVLSDGFAIGSCQASFTDGSTSALLTVMNNYVSH